MAQFLSDQFTDTNGTTLDSHVAENGATWSKHAGATGVGTIQSNRVWFGATAGVYTSVDDPDGADYSVTAGLTFVSLVNTCYAGVIARADPTVDTEYMSFAYYNGTNVTVYIKRTLAGVGTDLASTTVTLPTVGSTHTLELRLRGSSLTALWDGVVTVGPVTDTNITAAGSAGLLGQAATSGTGTHIDYISATEPSSRTLARIPNRHVGPMALRQAFRRADPWTTSPDNNLSGTSADTAVTVGLTAGGVVGTSAGADLAITAGVSANGFSPSSFVTRDPESGFLKLNGQRVRFAGANCANDIGTVSSSNGNGYSATVVSSHYITPTTQVTALIDSARQMNMNVLKATWSVQTVANPLAVQPTFGVFNVAALDPIDWAIYQCGLYGIKLVIPFCEEPAGTKQWYVTNTTNGPLDDFYTDAPTIAAYKAHISFVLNHVNPYTGVALKYDPTVLCWQTGNEFTVPTLSWAQYATWGDDIGHHIKVVEGAQQLVMDGHYGINNADTDPVVLQMQYIDLYDDHSYNSTRTAAWMDSHEADYAHSYGKAFSVGEYTWTDDTGTSGGHSAVGWVLDDQLTGYETMGNFDIDTWWDLLAPLTSWGDGFTLHSPPDATLNSPTLAQAQQRWQMLADHALRMSGKVIPGNFVLDTFTDANGTAGTSHVGEHGAAWTYQGGWTGATGIQGNRLSTTGATEAHLFASGVPAGIDYTVSADIYTASVLTNAFAGVTARCYTVGDYCYQAFIFYDGATATIYLQYGHPGTDTTLNSKAVTLPTVGSTHNLRLTVKGSLLSVFWDDDLLYTATDSNLRAAGRVGTIHGGGSGSTGFLIDNYSATDVMDAPPAPPQLVIPNRYVGPMALRNAFRRPTPWTPATSLTDFTGAANASITVGLTADGVVGTVGNATTAITVGLTADGVVGETTTATSSSITVGLTAGGVVGITTTAVSTDVVVGLGASGYIDELHAAPPLIIPNRYVGPMALRNAFRRAQQWITGPDNINAPSTDLSITVGLGADGVVGTSSTASSSITVGLTAAGTVGTVGSASTAITVGLTADGLVGDTSTASSSITVGLTADGVLGAIAATVSTDVTVGLSAAGSVDELHPAPPLVIPNRYVGPMALRQAFRRADRWVAGVDATTLIGSSTDTTITVGLSADGVVGTVGTASSSITVGLSAAGAVGVVGTTSTTITVGASADGVVGVTSNSTSADITVGLSASGYIDELHPAPALIIPNRYVGPMALRQAFRRAQQWITGPDNFNGQSTDTTITVGLTADGVLGTVGTESSSITVGLSADGVVGTVGNASIAITVGQSADGVVGTTGAASTAITVGLSADGVVGLVGSADTAISVGIFADGVNPANVPPAALPPFQIPNRYVGPMALRNAFRRADQWLNQLISYLSDSVATAITVGLSAAGVTGTRGDASTAITVGLSAAGTAGAVGQASSAITVGLSAAGVLGAVGSESSSITVGLTADGVVGLFGDATSSITVGLTAAGSVDELHAAPPLLIPNRYVGPMALRQAFRRADKWTSPGSDGLNGSAVDTSITVGLTAGGVVGVVSSDTASITVGLTAAGVVGEFGAASTSITVGLAAAGAVGVKQASVTTDITVGVTAAGVVGLRASGNAAITVGLTADGFITSDHLTGAASTAVVIGLTAAGVVGTSSTASTGITIGLSAAGIVLVATPIDRIHVIDAEDDEFDVAGEDRIHVVEIIAFTSLGPGEDRIYIVPAEVRTT